MKAKTPPVPATKSEPNKSKNNSGVNSHKRSVHNSHLKAAQSGLGKYASKQ